MEVERQAVLEKVASKAGGDSPGTKLGPKTLTRWSSPLVRQHLSGLHNNDSRDSSLCSLRQHVQHMEPSAIPRFVHHVAESAPEGSSRNYAVGLYADCARTHGSLIIPHMPKVMTSVLRQLAQDWSTPKFHQACAEVLLEIIRLAPTDAAQSEEVLASMAGRLAPSLGDRCEQLANGAAVCLHALVVSEKWKLASEETLEAVWKCTAEAVADPLRTLPHLQLARALARTNSHLLQEYAKPLLASAQDILLGASAFQQRLYAVKLAREVLTRCEGSVFFAEVGNMADALLSCGVDRVELVSQEIANLLKVIQSLQDNWAPMAFAEDFSSPGLVHSPQKDLPSRFKTPPRRQEGDPGGEPAGADPLVGSVEPLNSPSGGAVPVARANSLGGRGPSPLRGSGTPSRSAIYGSPTLPGTARSRYRSPTVSSMAHSRQTGGEEGSGGAGLGGRDVLRRASSGARANGMKAGGSPGLVRARLEYGQSPDGVDEAANQAGRAVIGSNTRGSFRAAKGAPPLGSGREKAAIRHRRMSFREGELGQNGGSERELMSIENGGRLSHGLYLTRASSTAESDDSNESREFREMMSPGRSPSFEFASPGSQTQHANPTDMAEAKEAAGGESTDESGGATSDSAGQAREEDGNGEDAARRASSNAEVLALTAGPLPDGQLDHDSDGQGAKVSMSLDGKIKDPARVQSAPSVCATDGSQEVAGSRDSSLESQSGCASTTSSSSGGKHGPIRLMRHLELNQPVAAKKRQSLTPEDTMRNTDPRRLLISLQSGSPAPAKEGSRKEPAAEAGAQEGESVRTAVAPDDDSNDGWIVRNNPIAVEPYKGPLSLEQTPGKRRSKGVETADEDEGERARIEQSSRSNSPMDGKGGKGEGGARYADGAEQSSEDEGSSDETGDEADGGGDGLMGRLRGGGRGSAREPSSGQKSLLVTVLLVMMKGVDKLLEVAALGCLGCVLAFLVSLLVASLVQVAEVESDLPPT